MKEKSELMIYNASSKINFINILVYKNNYNKHGVDRQETNTEDELLVKFQFL